MMITHLELLNYLVDLYEAKTPQGSVINVEGEMFDGYHEEVNAKMRSHVNQIVRKLELKHFVKVEWHQPFQMQRMKKISLNENRILEIYHVLRRKPTVKNNQLLRQIFQEYAKERTRLGAIATDLMRKIDAEEPLFQVIRVASIEEVEDAMLAIKALLRNHVMKSQENFSLEVFGEEETFGQIEYIIKPILRHYNLIPPEKTHDYLDLFYIRAEETYVHMRGCGDFEINGVHINLATWPSDFVVNAKTLENFIWKSTKLKRIVVATSYHDFIDYHSVDDLILYCKTDILTATYIQTHFPMFMKQRIPLIRRSA